ncbi:MAG TPA: hypothetical protein PK530_12485 [Anaerolineales bacterium]|nr:hypothetical protein [Anaerolineales bacterium]
MDSVSGRTHIIIAPQIYISLDPQETTENREAQPKRTEIPMTWIQDGDNFRLDIDLPKSSVLDVSFSLPVASLHVNGETIWSNNTVHAVQIAGAHVEESVSGLRLTCTSGGSIHILARSAIPEPVYPL